MMLRRGRVPCQRPCNRICRAKLAWCLTLLTSTTWTWLTCGRNWRRKRRIGKCSPSRQERKMKSSNGSCSSSTLWKTTKRKRVSNQKKNASLPCSEKTTRSLPSRPRSNQTKRPRKRAKRMLRGSASRWRNYSVKLTTGWLSAFRSSSNSRMNLKRLLSQKLSQSSSSNSQWSPSLTRKMHFQRAKIYRRQLR